MSLIQNKIIKAGSLALAELEKSQEMVVLGVTSRGIFLKNINDRIVFISQEKYCSPLTILVMRNPGLFSQVNVGDKVTIGSDGLHFIETGILLNSQDVIRWAAAEIPLINPEISIGIAHRLSSITTKVVNEKKEQGFSPILAKVLDICVDEIMFSREQQFAYEKIHMVEELIKYPPEEKTMELLEGLLGLGRGLTPSGDDVLTGMLLALNRWRPILDPTGSWEMFGKEIIPKAYRKTTLISANLIEAAASGMGDERLIYGLDGIMGGYPNETICAANFISLGSSSGADALLGITLAVRILD